MMMSMLIVDEPKLRKNRFDVHMNLDYLLMCGRESRINMSNVRQKDFFPTYEIWFFFYGKH